MNRTAPWTGEPVAVLGAGPVGQTTALLLARWGVPTVLLDQRPARDAIGSKAICQQGDVLDVWAAVGAGEQIAAEGVTWTTARTFHRAAELFSYTFAAAGRSAFPPFVNISQTRTEQILDERIAAEPLIDLRWGHRVDRDRAGRRRRHAVRRDAAGPVRAAGVLPGVCCGRPRRRAAPAARGELRRALLRRPLPDLRHPRRAARLGQRAAVLLRPGVEPGPAGAHPSLPGLDVPHRLAGPGRLRPGRRGRVRRAGRAHPGDHRRPGLRDRLVLGVPVPLPLRGPDAGRPGAAGRRRRAPGLAVRRARAQLRGGRRRERGLEDRLRGPGLGAGGAAGELPRRAARGGPGEHRGDHGDHGLPGAAGRGPGAAAGGGAGRGGDRPGAAGAGRLRPAGRAVLVRRLAADHARRRAGRSPAGRRAGRSPRPGRGCCCRTRRSRPGAAGSRAGSRRVPAARGARAGPDRPAGRGHRGGDAYRPAPDRWPRPARPRRGARRRGGRSPARPGCWSSPRSTRTACSARRWPPAPARCGSSGRTRTSPPCSTRPTTPELVAALDRALGR